MKQRIAINGRYVVRKQTGQERFAQELIRGIDNVAQIGEFVLVVPKWADNNLIPHYKNIEIVKYGNIKSHFWEQTNFYWYCKKHKMLSLNLTTTCPLLNPGIVCLHDACLYEINNLLTQNLYGKLSTAWHKIIFKCASNKAKHIITVSEYSKQKLMQFLCIPEDGISVVYNSWQHIDRVEADCGIFDRRQTVINKKQYFMALSSLTPQKNFIWVKEVAKRNLNEKFVIVGSAEGFTKLGEKELQTSNLVFTGYLTDGEIKALMTECKAFIHPAIYEGFGIPPLEAMSCGAELILSPCTCLPEIYEKSAHYIDPYKYDVDLDALLQEPVESAQKILDKFNWQREAEKLYDILKTI